MQLTELGKICKINMGQAPSGSSYNDKGSGYALIAGAGDFGTLTPKPKKFTTKPTRKSAINDIILCIRATIGDLNWSDKEYCLGRGVAGLTPQKDILDKDYLWHFIKLKKNDLEALGTGSTFKQINRSHIEDFKIPLPSLEEQKKVAAILNKADELLCKRKKAIQLTDNLLRSVFLDMFGDPVTNPKGWPVCKIGDVTDCIVPGRDKPKSFTGEIPWITTKDLRHLDITTEPQDNFIGLSIDEIKEVGAKIIPPNSVLITCVGDLGITSISGPPMIINQQLHSFQCTEKVTSPFLMFALSYQKGFMLKMASSTTVPYMNKTICNSIPITVPPLNLQVRFSNFFKRVKEIHKSEVNAFNLNGDLFSSLAQRSFKGNL